MKYDELNRKRQKLHRDEQKLAYHVKLYKSGTFWIAAGITTVVLGITTLTGVSVASAATTDATETVKPAENSVSASSYRLKTSETAQTAASTESTGTVNNDSSISKETGDKSVDVAAKVTNLGDANRTQIDQAKEAASEQYTQTGQPQVVTAVSAPTPETAATGQVTIKYVDEDTKAEIADSYVATTTIKPDLVTEAKVKSDFTEPFISGYTFDKLGEGDTLNFAPVADGKTITAYYKNNSVTAPDDTDTTTEPEATPETAVTGQITIKYVDEDTQAEIADSYVATTTIKSDLVTEAKVKSDFTEPFISGYTFDKLGEGDTLNFAPVADGKTITAYYKNNSVTTPVTAPDTTTNPTNTATETTPETTVTGQITIKYVDEDNSETVLSFNRDNAGFPSTAPATISGSYTATTTVDPDLVTKMKVKDAYAQPRILGYTFDKLGEGDTLNFAPVTDGKTITAYYKSDSPADTTTEPTTTQTETTPETAVTGQITIKYVDEDTQKEIADSYVATTTIKPDLVTEAKVKSDFTKPTISGYTFDKLGEGDTLNFAPVTDGKTITAYYKNNSVTAPDTTMEPETTPETTPETAVTGQITIKYVDEDTQTEIADSYVATTTIKPDLVTEAKVKSDFTEPSIEGYTFDKLGEGDTLNFAPVADGKTITAYYKNNSATVPDDTDTTTEPETTPETAVTGQITIKYVDEDTQAEIADSYVATTTIKSDLVTEAKVKSDFTEPSIEGYTFDKLGEGDTLNFAPVADGKTITAYYKNNSVTTPVTAPDTTTEPINTATETTPEATVTGQITIKYVDEDNPETVLSFNRDNAGFPSTAPATISGSYTATTTVDPDLVTKMKVKDAYAQPRILGYTFDKLGEGDTLNFAPVTDGKTITAYYKSNSPADTTTEPTTTQTETTPETTVTGQVTIAYVDKDTQQLLGFNSGQSSIPGTPVQINGTYVAQTTVSTVDPSQLTVSGKVAQAEIAGYKFVGNDTTDLTFAPVDQQKTIKAYYEKLAPVVINYVNEAAPADVIFQIEYDAQDPANWISGSADYNFDYEPTFNGYTYDEQETQADSVLIGNGFKSLDDTDGQPVTINIYYKKTTADPNPGAMYIGDTITKVSDITDTAVKKTNDLETPGAAFAHDKLPEVSAAKPITSAAVAINGHVVNQYPNYTLTGTIGTNNQDGNLAQGLMPLADYIPNQPVEVVFVDDSTGNILQQGLYGDFDLDKGVLPSGNYDTGVVNEAYQAKLADEGYELAKVYGEPTGTYDAMHRIVYYVYTPKLATNYVPVTRLINFTSSDGALNINPIVQTVWYKKVTNEVTNQSIYTPQSGFNQYEIPIVSGYSATINDQPASAVAQEGLPATTGMPTNESVTVNYVKLPPVIVPSTEEGETLPHDDTGNTTTDNQVPTPTEDGGATTVETGEDNGSAVPNKGGSSAQTGVTTLGTSKQETNIISANGSSTTHDQLPQTDEDNDGALGLLGAVLISVLGLSGIKKKRRD